MDEVSIVTRDLRTQVVETVREVGGVRITYAQVMEVGEV
jgi:hypothetical protein